MSVLPIATGYMEMKVSEIVDALKRIKMYIDNSTRMIQELKAYSAATGTPLPPEFTDLSYDMAIENQNYNKYLELTNQLLANSGFNTSLGAFPIVATTAILTTAFGIYMYFKDAPKRLRIKEMQIKAIHDGIIPASAGSVVTWGIFAAAAVGAYLLLKK